MTFRMTRNASLIVVGLLMATLAFPAVAGAQGRGGQNRGGQGGSRPQQDRGLYREKRFIVHLYQGFLNRQPSPREVSMWTEKMGGGASPEELVRDFMNSDEFFIRQSYIGLLGREPDADGMDTFARALRRGENRAFVVESIIASPEFRGRMRN